MYICIVIKKRNNMATKTAKRFYHSVRFTEGKLLPYNAYLTDRKTCLKFSSCFETEQQARGWIANSIETLTNSTNR